MENRDRDKKNPKQGEKQTDVDFEKNIGSSDDLNKPGRSSSSGDRSQSGSMGKPESNRRPSGADEQ